MFMKKIIKVGVIFSFWAIGFCLLGKTNKISASDTLKILMPKTKNVHVYDFETLKPKITFNGKKVNEYDFEYQHWYRSNKKITLEEDSFGETTCDVYGKKPGKSKLTLKVKYIKYTSDGLEIPYYATATCYINVKKYKTMRVTGGLTSYNIRSNTFTMKIRNISTKSIKIYSKGARSYDCDYTNYDRKLKLTKKRKYIKIKPMQKKTIKFKVIGRHTWWNVDDHEVQSTWKYGKKKYTVSVDVGDASKWSGGKWKSITNTL